MSIFNRALLLGAAGALAISGAAWADMSGLVGNSIVVNTPNGAIKVQLHADGSYQTIGPKGPIGGGTWSEDSNGGLCYNQTSPAPAAGAPNPFCAPGMSGKKVGDSWSQAGQGGATMTLSVAAGQ